MWDLPQFEMRSLILLSETLKARSGIHGTPVHGWLYLETREGIGTFNHETPRYDNPDMKPSSAEELLCIFPTPFPSCVDLILSPSGKPE